MNFYTEIAKPSKGCDISTILGIQTIICFQYLRTQIFFIPASQNWHYSKQYFNGIGCRMEQDSTWNITWPATNVSDTAIQKCPGGGEAAGSLIYNTM